MISFTLPSVEMTMGVLGVLAQLLRLIALRINNAVNVNVSLISLGSDSLDFISFFLMRPILFLLGKVFRHRLDCRRDALEDEPDCGHANQPLSISRRIEEAKKLAKIR